MKGGANKGSTGISATDLSPIEGMDRNDEDWLRELARNANSDTLSLSFVTQREVQQAPIVSYDSQTGIWWAGRFVGELTYQGRTLTILPRFGMPALRRWLSRIWGIRLLSSTGRYASGKIWLWELIARLWSDRIVVAAKHGLPCIRIDEVHSGSTVRGRLLVRQTAVNLHLGRQMLVSRTRIRRIDSRIGGVLLGAYDHLRQQLRDVAEPRLWLTDRGHELVKELQSSIDRRAVEEACRSRSPIRYTPISESYRPAIDLSLTILGRHPFMSSAEGSNAVYGALLDMAEIWELYLFHLIRDALSEAEVTHAGRSSEAVFWLLTGKSGDRIGAMKPDILLSSRDGARRIILDAKYKSTTPSPSRPHGVLREDLYQMAAYLSVEAISPGTLDGGLVYPSSTAVSSLESKSPFRVQRSDAQFFFFGLNCSDFVNSIGLTPAEIQFVAGLRSHLQL